MDWKNRTDYSEKIIHTISCAENIGKLLNRVNYFFVHFKQDNPIEFCTKYKNSAFNQHYFYI